MKYIASTMVMSKGHMRGRHSSSISWVADDGKYLQKKEVFIEVTHEETYSVLVQRDVFILGNPVNNLHWQMSVLCQFNVELTLD